MQNYSTIHVARVHVGTIQESLISHNMAYEMIYGILAGSLYIRPDQLHDS